MNSFLEQDALFVQRPALLLAVETQMMEWEARLPAVIAMSQANRISTVADVCRAAGLYGLLHLGSFLTVEMGRLGWDMSAFIQANDGKPLMSYSSERRKLMVVLLRPGLWRCSGSRHVYVCGDAVSAVSADA